MKRFKIKIIFFVLFAFNLAFAGNEGGGGKSVVCRDTQNKITNAEILDLFEGKTQYQLNYSESPMKWQDQALKIFENSGVSLENEIYKKFQNVINHLNILSDEIVLNDTNDSFEVVAPKGCKIEQAAIYINDNQILINGEIWKALSETQKTALIIHESVYRYLRDYGEKNSKRARHFTAHLLSGKKMEKVIPKLEEIEAVCSDPEAWNSTTFYIYSSAATPKNGRIAKVQFENIGGRKILSKAVADILLMDNQKDLWEELVFPGNDFYINPTLPTESSFEPGDELLIYGKIDSSGKMHLYVRGYSAIDGSSFNHQIRCGALR